MRLGLSTTFARAVGLDPDRIVDLCLRSGARGVELDATLGEGLVDALATRLGARREELPVWVVDDGCLDRRRATAALASRDRDEAAVALAAATDTLRFASELGARMVAIRLGEVTRLAPRWPAWRRALLRGELDEAARAELVAERAAYGQAHLDGARRALDRLGRIADGMGLLVGVLNPARVIGLPTPTELGVLLADLAGAPVFPLWDVPATDVASRFGPSTVEIAEAWRGSPVARVGDACGAVAGLAPGAGELDLPSLTAQLGPTTDAIFAPWPRLGEEEVREGMAAIAQLLRDVETARGSNTRVK